MEQKFTFKRLLSLIVVFTMLFSTFAILAVPAGAEVDVFWAEGDYEIADNGNYSAKHAYGYVFNVAGIDSAPSENNKIFTSDATWKTTNGWAVSVVLELVEGNTYEVVTVYNAPQLSGDWKNTVTPLAENQIVLMAHSSASYPAYEGETLKYANWQDKVAAVALGNTVGAKVTLAGIDLAAGTATDATVTVQDAPVVYAADGDLGEWSDDWTVVNGETGFWQNVPEDEAELAGYYNFQITSDDTNLYVAAEIVDLTCTAFRIWFRTNPEATVYTHFYHIDANGAAGKVNTSTTANSATAITDSKAVGVFAAGEDSIIVEVSIPLAEIGATSGDVEYYANTQSGSTLFYPPVAEGETDRLANLPYKNWYVAPAEDEGGEDEPAEPEQHDILVSHVNAYTWGVFNSMVIYGADENCVTKLGYDCQWWIAIKVDDVDGVLTVTDIEGSGDAKENKATEGGFILYVYSNDTTSWAAAELVEVGDVLLNADFDYTVGAGSETPIGTMSFGPAREDEGGEDEDLVELPEDAIVLDYAGYVHDSFFMIVAGDNMTVADLTALGIGSAKDMNYCYVAVVDADGVVIEMHTTLGRPDGVKSDVVCPEGGYLLVLNANKAGADALLAANVGDSIELYNIDVDSFRGEEGSIALENAGFVIVPAEDEPVDDTPYDIGLNFDFEDNVVVGGEDAAKDLLTDGDYALDAEGWGGNHDGVVLIQNVTANSASESWATLVYKFEGTPDYYNTIKLGLYSDVNYMIGYPSEDDVYFSNDGVNWVSGYYDLGYGETIPDVQTTFDSETPTAPGTVVAKIMLENPQNYRFVKIDFYFDESPFTEANGYNPAKPTWEFFGLTEIEFGYEEPSSIITDFNITEYWESRYGRGAGSFGFTTAEDFQIAWDSFITSSYKSVVFAPVEGEDSVYEIIEMANGNITSFPEGGFVWSVYTGCEENSPAAAAIDLFATMAVGETYKFTGFDFENLFVVKEATIEKVEATTPEPDDATNVLLGVQFDKLTGTYYTYGSVATDGSELTDGYYITAGNLNTSLYADDNVAGFGGLSGATLELEGALDATYAIDKIVIHYANGKTGSGICEPAVIKAFYKNGEGEWIQFGETFNSTETDDNMASRYDFLISTLELTVDTAVEATDIRFEMTPRSGKTMVFISELEAWGEEVVADDEPAYKEGLTIEIDDTLVGWIGGAADLETIEGGLTDGNWGAGDANNWNNVDGVYPFQNKVCTDNTQFPEVNLIFNFGEATKFNTIDLGVYSSYNVMIGYPSALVTVYTSENGFEWGDCYEAYLDMDIPEIGNEGSVKATAKLATALEAQFVKVVLTFPESPFESKPVWEFMGLTEIELSYVPVTSNVVTDFNPTGYKNSIGGATGAFIYDDADIYAACANDWWIHVAFAPVADMDGYYEVVAVRAPTTGNYLTIPENGFVWMAWSSAGDTPESAGAYALAFMGNLKVGDIVEFVGVDFVNHTTEADAYAEVWIDPNAPVNVALNKDYTTSGPDDTTYNAKLTDGNAYGAVSYDNKWFVFNGKNTVDGIGTVIIDLDGAYSISKLSVNLVNETVSGIAKPEYVKFFVSADGEEWTEVGAVELQDVQSTAYWSALEGLELEASFVKLEMKIGSPFSFLNEIEVYGNALPAEPVDVELVVGENNITVPAGTSANATTNFEEDYVIVIENNWSVSVVVNGVEYYPNRGGYLEAPLAAGENTVEFKNGGEEAAEIVVDVTAPVIGDTMDDPIVIEDLGDFTAEVTDKYPEGVYYEFVATEDGFLTITINSEDGWMYVINNVTAGKYGDNHWSDDEEVVASETIEVKAGDVIAILVATYDPENPWSAPAGSVDFTLGTPAGEDDTIEYALGDVNMDGKVDQYDYILVKRHYFGTRVLTGVELELADVNNDEVVDQYDYILLCRHYFGTFTIEGTVEVAVEAE